MYCPNCGQELGEDSRFCPKCGDTVAGQKENLLDILMHFRNLNLKWQLILIVLFICGTYLSPLIVLLCIIFYWKPMWSIVRKIRLFPKRKKKNKLVDIEPITEAQPEPEPKYPQLVSSYSLVRFSSLHGKMSRVTEYDKKTMKHHVLFRFTDDNETVVIVTTPDESIAQLTGAQIAELKDSLCINEYSDGTYDLRRRAYSANRTAGQ